MANTKKSSSSKKAAKKAAADAAVAAAAVAAAAVAAAAAAAAAAPPADAKVGTKRKSDTPVRHRNGTKTLHQIAKLQSSIHRVTKMKPLNNEIRRIANAHTKDVLIEPTDEPVNWRFKPETIYVLCDARENVFVDFMSTARDNSLHSDRKTVHPKDILLADQSHLYSWWSKHNQKANSDRCKAALEYTRRKASTPAAKAKAAKAKKERKAKKDAAAAAAAALVAAPAAAAAPVA